MIRNAIPATFGLTLTLSVLAASAAVAQDAADPSPQVSYDLRLEIRSNPDRFLERQLGILFKITPDGELTPDVVDRYRRIRMAEFRAEELGSYLWMDLDGDGAVSTTEAAIAIDTVPEASRPDLDRVMSDVDADGDGTISLDEMAAASKGRVDRKMQRSDLTRRLLELDMNGDGGVNARELDEAIKRIAAEPLPPRGQKRSRDTAAEKNRPDCTYPRVPTDAELVLIGSYEAGGLSPISVSGPDRETNIARIFVEPGDKPLFLVAVSYDPVIWKIEGSVDRVAGMLAQRSGSGEQPGVGVVGLDRGKVAFLRDFRCLDYVYKSEDVGKIRLISARIAAGTGHEVDHVVGQYKIGALAVPSGSEVATVGGRLLPQPPGSPYIGVNRWTILNFAPNIVHLVERWLWQAAHVTPGEPAFAVADVVAPGPVIEYEVLPGKAGLVQLVASGAVTRTLSGHYRVIRDIPRFPPGLYGAQSVTFEIARGVKLPPGNPGHSRVYVEDPDSSAGN